MSARITCYKIFPAQLLRVNNGRSIRLREHGIRLAFDVALEGGYVKAKSRDPATYIPPNGASMRPYSAEKRDLIESYRGNQVVVYTINAGTRLPDDLVLVHEFRDHYSLQPDRDMPLQDLNSKITDFLESNGNVTSKDEWLRQHPAASSSANGWVWDADHQKYRYWNGQQWIFQ